MAETIKDRLLQFIDAEGIEKARFEKESGLSNGFVDKVGSSIRSKSLDKIRNGYPHLNIDWLKTGEGEKIRSENINIKDDSNIANTETTATDITVSDNTEKQELLNKIQKLEADITQLKKDKAILQSFVSYLQNGKLDKFD